MSAWKTWLPCLGSLIVQMTIFGMHNNFGLIYHYLMIEFKQSRAETAWVGSFAMGLTFLLCPLGNLVLSTVGFTYTITLSTFLCVTSLVASSFVNSVHLLILTYSLVWGCGSALAQQASLLIIQENYRGKLSLANGITSSGSGLGTLVLGPFMAYLLHNYNFRFAFRVCAATPLFFLLTILFVKMNKTATRVEDEEKGQKDTKESIEDSKENKEDIGYNTKANIEENKDTTEGQYASFSVTENIAYDCEQQGEVNIKQIDRYSVVENEGYGCEMEEQLDTGEHFAVENNISNENDKAQPVSSSRGRMTKTILQSAFNKELWTNKTYVCYIVGVSIFLFGYFIPFVFMVEKAARVGIRGPKAQLLISILSIISTITKIFGGYILDTQKRVRISTVVLMAMYCMSLSHLIPGFATEYWHFVVFSVIFGVCEGFFVGQLCAVVTQIVPKIELVGTAISNVFAFMSLSLMIGPVVAGKLSTMLGSLDMSFFVATGISLWGAAIATLLKVFESRKSPSESQYELDTTPAES